MTTKLPRLGACSCRRGVERDNCPNCEGTGNTINWAAYWEAKYRDDTSLRGNGQGTTEGDGREPTPAE